MILLIVDRPTGNAELGVINKMLTEVAMCARAGAELMEGATGWLSEAGRCEGATRLN